MAAARLHAHRRREPRIQEGPDRRRDVYRRERAFVVRHVRAGEALDGVGAPHCRIHERAVDALGALRRAPGEIDFHVSVTDFHAGMDVQRLLEPVHARAAFIDAIRYGLAHALAHRLPGPAQDLIAERLQILHPMLRQELGELRFHHPATDDQSAHVGLAPGSAPARWRRASRKTKGFPCRRPSP